MQRGTPFCPPLATMRATKTTLSTLRAFRAWPVIWGQTAGAAVHTTIVWMWVWCIWLPFPQRSIGACKAQCKAS